MSRVRVIEIMRRGPRGAPGDMDPAEWDALQEDIDAKLPIADVLNEPDMATGATDKPPSQASVDAFVTSRLATKLEGEDSLDDDIHHGFVDENDRASWLTGTRHGGIPPHTQHLMAEAVAPLLQAGLLPGVPEEISEGTGWHFAIADLDDRIAFGIRTDGTVWPESGAPEPNPDPDPDPEPDPDALPAFETLLGTGHGLLVRTPDGGPRPYTSSPDRVAFWGDSLIEGYPVPPFADDGADSIPGVFATLHTDGTILNGGYAGKTADEIAIFQGGLMIEVVPSGGTIPSTGTVTLTTAQTPRWRLSSPSGFSVHGTVAGVAGQLTRTSATTFDFTRDASGDAVPVADPVPFYSDQCEGYFDAISVIFAGRNDISYFDDEADVTDRVVAATAAIVSSLTPLHPRVLLLGTINATGETEGTPGHTLVVTINDTLAALYPDSFFDVRRYLIDDAIYDAGITPTGTDLSQMAADRIPGSLMVDTVHFTPAAAAVVAQRLYDEMTTRGWL